MSEPSFTSNPNLVTIHAVRLEAWGAEEDGRKVHQRIKGWTTSPSWFVPNLHRGLHQLWTIEDACEYGSLRFQVDRFSFMKMSGRPNMLLVIQAASEIARAMECLHLSGKVHGRLSSSTVFLQRKLAEEGAALSSPYLPDSRVASSHAGSATSRASLDQDRAQSAVMWQSVVTGYINESFLQQASTGTDSLRVDLFGSNEMTSVAHLAPEVLINGQATQATDVYAFSIILWQVNDCIKEGFERLAEA